MLADGCCVLQLCSVIGILYVGKWTLSLLCGICTWLRVALSSRLRKRNLVAEYGGKWAAVTGSTDGIGKEYARQLAKKGLNIVLISRSPERLKNVEQEIRKEFGVDTHTIAADFSHGRQIYEGIAEGLKDKDIGILVNNVGFFGGKPKKFDDVPEDDIWRYVNVNAASVVAMTKLVLPQMLARRRGAIVNISSMAALLPFPYASVYSATKAFVTYFSEALEYEYRQQGITVQCVQPGVVTTKMPYSRQMRKPGFMKPTPSTYVSSALATLGRSKVTAGIWDHALQTAILTCLCKRFSMYLTDKMTESVLKEEEQHESSKKTD